MSHSDKKRVHLARGLVFNAEVLALHRPTDGWDREEAELVVNLLREVVDKRGLQNSRPVRRPRTVFFTVGEEHPEMMSFMSEQVDYVWKLEKNELPKEERGG